MTEPVRPLPSAAGRPEPLASRLRTTLLRTSRRLRDQRVGDLTDAQLAVLGQLVGHGALTPSELAEREHVRPPSMTKTIQHLLAAGLIERRAHPDDGRQILIEVSTQGREHILATRRRRDEWLKKRLAALTREERATLSAAEELLRRIYSQ